MSSFGRPSVYTERDRAPLKTCEELEKEKKKQTQYSNSKSADPPPCGVITRSMRDKPMFQPIYDNSTQKEEYIKNRKRPAADSLSPLAHHHKKQFELYTASTQDDMLAQPKKQHFQYGRVADGQPTNKMLYSADPLIVRDPVPRKRQVIRPTASTILYGENDTNVGYANMGAEGDVSGRMEKKWLEPTSADVSRKNREIVETEEFIHQHKQAVMERKVKEAAAKKKDYEMLTNYSPWGKPGAGAPNKGGPISPRQTDFLTQSLPVERSMGGGGAPIKTNSGRHKTHLLHDPNIYFQKRQREQILNVIGPKQIPANPITAIELQAAKSREERNVKKWYDGDDNKIYDPFGRPGAGAPVVDDKGHVSHRNYNGNDVVDIAVKPQSFAKDASLPYGTPRLKKQIIPPSASDPDRVALSLKLGGKGGGGAPRYDKSGNLLTHKSQTLQASGDNMARSGQVLIKRSPEKTRKGQDTEKVQASVLKNNLWGD